MPVRLSVAILACKSWWGKQNIYIYSMQYLSKIWTPTHSRVFLNCFYFLHYRIIVKTKNIKQHIWNNVVIKNVFNKSIYSLYLRFFKVATLCLDDNFTHSWHSLNQLHEIVTWNAFQLTDCIVKNYFVEFLSFMRLSQSVVLCQSRGGIQKIAL